MKPKHYPIIGGDLTYAMQRLAEGADKICALVIIYRGSESAFEVGMTVRPGYDVGATEFRQLKQAIMDGVFAENLSVASKRCLMLAGATDAECLMLITVARDGAVDIGVNQPIPETIMAGLMGELEKTFVAMN